MKRALVTAAGAALALLAVALAPAADAPDRILMPHALHAAGGVGCETCHPAAATAGDASVSLRPGMDACAGCHDVADEAACATCHANVAAAGATPRAPHPARRFSHAAHAAQGMACATCHGDAAGEPRLPTKPECRACHATADDYADCRFCHADAMDLRPASHDALWGARHGGRAQVDIGGCATCHTQGACQQCHAGDDVRPRVHPLDFEFAHGVRARGHEQECAACHGEPEFCASCHAQRRVLPDSHSRAGWLRAADGGRHAEEGRLDIESCLACHGEGRDAPACAACHGG